MDVKNSIMESKINAHETAFEDTITYDKLLNKIDMDIQILDMNLLGWIELIENENLYDAVKKLNYDEQILLNYIFYEERTQSGNS